MEDIVELFRILSTMEPKRNNFRCPESRRKIPKNRVMTKSTLSSFSIWRHNLARPRSPIRAREPFRVGLRRGTENRGFDRFKKILHWNTPKNTLILLTERKKLEVRWTLSYSCSFFTCICKMLKHTEYLLSIFSSFAITNEFIMWWFQLLSNNNSK